MKPRLQILQPSGFPECWEKECPQARECPNHYTAGDFRLEGGNTPSLRKRGFWLWHWWECDQTLGDTIGARLADGSNFSYDNMPRE